MMDDLERLSKIGEESATEVNSLFSRLKEGTEFETQLSEHRTELLFKIATEIEEATMNLERAEQLVNRLKKHLKQLKELQQVLSK